MVLDQALITPQILRWARQRDKLAPETVAERADITPERLLAWESGKEHPTFDQARSLAGALRVPFGFLFLSTPPRDTPALPDLRTIAAEPVRAPSAELRDVLNDALEKQQWMKEYRQDEGWEPLPFVGRYSLKDDPEIVAADIAATIGLNDELRERGRRGDFLGLLTARVEGVGVLVLRSGVADGDNRRPLSVAEFRGFAVMDDLAPLVFVNTSDAKTAQVFTLLHELAHIWLGKSGISNPNYSSPVAAVNTVEQVSNKIATEVLLPREQFLARWKKNEPLETKLRQLSASFRVSELVVLRQAFDHGLIANSTYRRTYSKFMGRGRRAAPKGGGNFYNTLLARNSPTLTSTLIATLAEGRVGHRDAARLLNVPIGSLDGVRKHVIGGEE